MVAGAAGITTTRVITDGVDVLLVAEDLNSANRASDKAQP